MNSTYGEIVYDPSFPNPDRPGETYNLGGNAEQSNLDVVRKACRLLDERAPGSGVQPYESLISFVTDRPGHDFRYALDTAKVGDELGPRIMPDQLNGIFFGMVEEFILDMPFLKRQVECAATLNGSTEPKRRLIASSPFERIVAVDLTIIEDASRAIAVAEGETTVPFNIRRVFFIRDLKPGVSRGGHAHRQTEHLLVPVCGGFDVDLTDGTHTVQFKLRNPKRGVYVPSMIWDRLNNFTPDAVCILLASTPIRRQIISTNGKIS